MFADLGLNLIGFAALFVRHCDTAWMDGLDSVPARTRFNGPAPEAGGTLAKLSTAGRPTCFARASRATVWVVSWKERIVLISIY